MHACTFGDSEPTTCRWAGPEQPKRDHRNLHPFCHATSDPPTPHTHSLSHADTTNAEGRLPSVIMVLALRKSSVITGSLPLHWADVLCCIRPPSRRWNGLLNPAWPHADPRSLCKSVAPPTLTQPG